MTPNQLLSVCFILISAGCVDLNERVPSGRDSGVAGGAGTISHGGTGGVPDDAAVEAGGSSGSGGWAGNGLPDASLDANLGETSAPRVLDLSGALGVHDPAIIASTRAFYIFATGQGIEVKRSTNLLQWEQLPPVFASNPSWIRSQVPNATALWAPDVSFFGNRYHLYYSASTFGSRRSCIGHATTADLDRPAWTDHGAVICSDADGDWNAIDPNSIIDEAGRAWLTFGSFWSGIKLFPLDANGARSGTDLISLASRRPESEAVEAPYIVRHGGYYYLFVSFDICCRGSNSTYNIRVGRSSTVTGPYVDATGKSLLDGGGTLVINGNTRWKGPGHNSALSWDGHDLLVYHAYDADRNGAPTLRIAEFVWQDGWPLSGGP
jgi:arabinan endo-1,5-alpha-L-arabinosidase